MTIAGFDDPRVPSAVRRSESHAWIVKPAEIHHILMPNLAGWLYWWCFGVRDEPDGGVTHFCRDGSTRILALGFTNHHPHAVVLVLPPGYAAPLWIAPLRTLIQPRELRRIPRQVMHAWCAAGAVVLPQEPELGMASLGTICEGREPDLSGWVYEEGESTPWWFAS